MTFRWQYPAKVEPVKKVVAGEDVSMDQWFMPASVPVWPKPRLVQEGFFVEPLEPDGFTAIPPPLMSTWFQPASVPVWPKPFVMREGFWGDVLDPNNFTAEVVIGDIIITLPDATWDGNGCPPMVRLKNVTSDASRITVNGAVVGGVQQTIDGADSFAMDLGYQNGLLISDGTNWMKWGFAGGSKVDVATKTVSSTTTLNITNDAIYADAAPAAFTITLPDASTMEGKRYYIKKIDSTSNIVTLSGTIDDGASADLTVQYESVTLVAHDSKWWIH